MECVLHYKPIGYLFGSPGNISPVAYNHSINVQDLCPNNLGDTLDVN